MKTLVFEEPFSVTFRVEGELNGSAGAELCDRVVMWQGLSKKIRLDAGDVSAVDAAGADCLRRLRERGVRFTAASPAVRDILQTKDAKENLRAWLARIGIQLPTSKPNERTGLFRRMLCAVLPAGVAGCPCSR